MDISSNPQNEGKTGVNRRSSIFPITITTPLGSVHLAYRVHEDGRISEPFVYLLDPGLHTEQGRAFLRDFPDLDDVISSAWWLSLTDEQRAEEDRCPGAWYAPIAPSDLIE